MTYPCSRCEGKGNIRGYSHVAGGICFKCGGSGKQAGKPSKSTHWAVIGHAPDGTECHAYNESATTAEKAVARARVTWAKASAAFRASVSLDDAFAVPRDEYWAARSED